jgi:hypothetical protein
MDSVFLSVSGLEITGKIHVDLQSVHILPGLKIRVILYYHQGNVKRINFHPKSLLVLHMV